MAKVSALVFSLLAKPTADCSSYLAVEVDGKEYKGLGLSCSVVTDPPKGSDSTIKVWVKCKKSDTIVTSMDINCAKLVTDRGFRGKMTVEGVGEANVTVHVRDIPRFLKSTLTCDPIPEEGIQAAVDLMKTGNGIYRYNCKNPALDHVAHLEKEIATFTGHKYCVAVNSCGSAIFVALKSLGVQPGDLVLSNVFTFSAVPSAIVHCNAVPVYVNTNSSFLLDLAHLEKKIVESKAKYFVLSYMRGKICDVEGAAALCKKYNVTFIEDCAHAFGEKFNGKMIGTFGEAGCYSSQCYKTLNSGDGGFLCSSNDLLAAKAMYFAGCYERLYTAHIARPAAEVCEAVRKNTPTFNIRMHGVTAAMIRPQLKNFHQKAEILNKRYDYVKGRLNAIPGFDVPDFLPQVEPINDCIQWNISGMEYQQVVDWVALVKSYGVHCALFGTDDNCRNFKNWEFAPIPDDCENSANILRFAIDMRLPYVFEEKDLHHLCDVLQTCYEINVDNYATLAVGRATVKTGGNVPQEQVAPQAVH